MKRANNYAIMARQAQERFLTYDQQELIEKLHLQADEEYLYTALFSLPYRISRTTGLQQRLENGVWADGNSVEEVLTLLDLVCDSRADRFVTGQYRTTQSFGHQFHRNLVEDRPSESALAFDRNPEGLKRACEALGGVPFPGPDVGYELPVFENLKLVLQFWQSDEEFPPQLRYFWDAGALRYLRYETMYYAIGLLEERLRELV